MSGATGTFDHVSYDQLDAAKNAFIQASRKTLSFAAPYGFVPNESLGASANAFALNLKPYIKEGIGELYVTLLPEGLGTADDARPEDLTKEEETRFWRNIGIKTVSVLTNDAASGGMQTILISLYLPSSTPDRVFNDRFMEGFLSGFVEGCKTVGCVYFSGETPQLKTKIYEGRLDIAGALFGVVPPGHVPIDGSKLAPGNQIVLVESSGPHENGFTTLRGLAEKLPSGYRTDIGGGVSYWEAINAPSKLYTPLVQALLKQQIIPTGLENITGHGWQKIMRSSKPFEYRIHTAPPMLPVFQFVQKHLGMTAHEMYSVFNCGTGFAVFVENERAAKEVVNIAKDCNLNAVHAGDIRRTSSRSVLIEPAGVTLDGGSFALKKG